VYRAEERSYGRVQEQMKDFAKRWVEPMIEKAGKAKLELDEVALYAYAMHAKERNADIARKNRTLQDGGSGMTDAEADTILQRFQAEGKTPALQDLHRDLMAITDTTRLVMLDEGLISRDEYDALQDQYDFYVPLRGFEQASQDGKPLPRRGAGSGFNVRGKETMKALGRTSRAGDVIENIINDYERAIVRAERNNVARAFVDFATANPDDALWEIDAVKTSRSLNKQTGQVDFSQTTDKGDKTISAKIGGKEVYVKIKDDGLARAMRLAFKEDTGGIARFLNNTLGLYTNWMRNVLTRYNPVFSGVNAVRDFQGGAVAVLDDLGVEGMNLYRKHYLAGMASSFRNERGTLDQSARQMDKWFEEFRAAGGTTGGFFMRDAEEIRNDLRQILVAAGAAPANTKERITGSKPYQGAKALLHYLEIVGSASENAARVAAYRAAREMGKTPAQAASIAKNLTTNFNRKGEWGQVLNSLYLFFNAAVQGTHRIARMRKNPKVWALMTSVAAASAGIALMGASAGGEDDDGVAYWDKIPQHVKERNLVIMLPPGVEMDGAEAVGKDGRYIKIPLPYVFNIFPVAGYQIADLMRYAADRNRGVSPAKAGLNMLSVSLGSLNPMGGAVDVTDPIQLGLAVSPTIGDLLIQLSAGVNSFGTPVGQFKSPYDPRPDSEIAGPKQAGSVEQRIARWLNEATGGNAGRSGAIDVQPATVSNLARTFGGGTGDFLYDVLINLPGKAVTPEAEILYNDVPFWKQAYGKIDKQSDIRDFYKNREEVLKEFNAMKREMELGMSVEYDEESQGLQTLGGMAESITKAVSALRREEVRIADDKSMTPAEKKLARQQLEKQRAELAKIFNTEYANMRRSVNAGAFKTSQ
jgi:hypothetical protein